MKNKVKKIWFLCFMLILMWSMSGCDDGKKNEKDERTELEESIELEETRPTEEPVKETPAVTTEPEIIPTPAPTATPTPKPQETLPPKSNIEYGDKINITCSKTTQELQWEYTGIQEFQVATTSKQFQNEFELSEEAAMKQVEEVIGKTVGDTFTLWYEGGDGLYGYEYTIVEVKSQNPDVAEYGDKLLADYSMTHYGVDTCDGEKTHTGQLPLHLLNTNAFFATKDGDGSCSLRQGDLELKKILGKTIGDQFKSWNSYYENSFYYQFTIKEIHKAVKYGDTIVAEVRETNTLDAKSYEAHSEEEWVLDLSMRDGLYSLDGELLSLENVRTLYKELIGKKAGDRAIFVRENRETREIYDIMIQGVTACESESEYAEEYIPLIMAEEDDLTKFYWYFAEYKEFMGDDPEIYPEIYSEPALGYIVIEDKNTQMFYEYAYYSDFYLCDKYEYTTEYDEKGRLTKETIGSSEWRPYDMSFEYKYNEQGICIEIIKYAPGYELHYYYDDSGNPINSKYISDDNRSEEYDYPY